MQGIGTRGGNKEPCAFPRSRLRFTVKAWLKSLCGFEWIRESTFRMDLQRNQNMAMEDLINSISWPQNDLSNAVELSMPALAAFVF